MIRIYISILTVAFFITCSFLLNDTKKKITAAINIITPVFLDPEHLCVNVSDQIFSEYSDLLPDTLPSNLRGKLIVVKLFDAITYIDDYGIDRKKSSEKNGVTTLEFYTAWKKGYWLSFSFSQESDCLHLLEINGMRELLYDKCRDN